MKVTGKGVIMPASKGQSVNVDNMNIEIVNVQTMQPLSEPVPYEIPMVRVKYFDGFERTYESASITDLMGKISGTLRSKYGVDSFEIASVPDTLATGTISIKNITY